MLVSQAAQDIDSNTMCAKIALFHNADVFK